jgi:hypothetical protein
VAPSEYQEQCQTLHRDIHSSLHRCRACDVIVDSLMNKVAVRLGVISGTYLFITEYFSIKVN